MYALNGISIKARDMKRIYNLQSLIALETISRHGSMSKAADEICVTQSAISHRIKKLEEEIGVVLLNRDNRKAELTEAGRIVVDFISPILDQLDGYHNLAKSIAGTQKLRIGVASAFYNSWLGPRLPEFYAASGNDDIEIVTLWSLEQFTTLRPDIAILPIPATTDIDQEFEQYLSRDEVFPVCRSDIHLDDPDIHLIELSRNLSGSSTQENDTNHELSWANWFDQVGDDFGLSAKKAYHYDTIALAMSAILHGSGVGLGRTILNVDHLNNGTLVRPLPCKAKVMSPTLYIVRHLSQISSSKTRDIFVEWLVAEVEASHKTFRSLGN